MKKSVILCLFLGAVLFAEEIPDSAVSQRDVSPAEVSLSQAEKCPSDSMLSANYAKCQQALSIAIGAQMDKSAPRDRSFEMAATTGSFVGGALIGLLLGWWLL